LLTVTQNAQAVGTSQQHRSYTFDQLGRLTSESNPETSNTSSNGTTTYTYDIACTTTAASPGDLTRKVDNAGNNTCFGYDSLHRPIAQGWNTVCRFFNYDTNVTPPSGVTVQNTKARLLEAYTTNCGASLYTDEWFSYSPRGELTDVYEKTPNSGSTFYHTSAAYWPNGTLQTLSGIASMPTLYYGASGGAGLDSEGRLTQVTASSGQNPLTGTTYSTSSTSNYLGALTGLTYGSADSDSFTYDPNTARPLSYKFTVNGQTDTGTLTWNANSTLASLGITDSISGTSDAQNCTYTYDDLGRIGGHDANGYSVDCGTKWQQLFTYDAFGNIAKSGSSSFAASYPNPNNHFTLSGGPTVQYDANGNLTTDNLNTYTWDPNWGNMTSVNTYPATYDAFGRVVEQKTGSSYTQVVYSPVGKTALMNGSSLLKGFYATSRRRNGDIFLFGLCVL
jgi:YD repeat-containing protein